MMRNSIRISSLQRIAGWCEAWEGFGRTHRGAVAVKAKIAANGYSRYRVKMCQHLKCILMG